MNPLSTAFARLDADDLLVMADEFSKRTEQCLSAGQDGWAQVYALFTVALVDALNADVDAPDNK